MTVARVSSSIWWLWMQTQVELAMCTEATIRSARWQACCLAAFTHSTSKRTTRLGYVDSILKHLSQRMCIVNLVCDERLSHRQHSSAVFEASILQYALPMSDLSHVNVRISSIHKRVDKHGFSKIPVTIQCCHEFRQLFWPLLGKKRRVLRSVPYDQDCWYTGWSRLKALAVNLSQLSIRPMWFLRSLNLVSTSIVKRSEMSSLMLDVSLCEILFCRHRSSSWYCSQFVISNIATPLTLQVDTVHFSYY